MGTPFEAPEPLDRSAADEELEALPLLRLRDGEPGGPAPEAALRLDAIPLGVTRRHLAWLLGALLVAALLLAFARAVTASASAMARAEALGAANAELRSEVEALRAEKELIVGAPFVRVAGRAYGYGRVDERPFSLAPGGPTPAPLLAPEGDGAPGGTPLDDWIALLVGR